MVLQQIDFIDIQKSAICARQQARFKRFFAACQRTLKIQRTNHAIFSSPQRQIDHRHGDQRAFRLVLSIFLAAIITPFAISYRITTVVAAFDHANPRQQCSECPHCRRLAGAAITEHQHPADRRINRGNQQGHLHFVLTDNRGERKRRRHVRSLSKSQSGDVTGAAATKKVFSATAGLRNCRRRPAVLTSRACND